MGFRVPLLASRRFFGTHPRAIYFMPLPEGLNRSARSTIRTALRFTREGRDTRDDAVETEKPSQIRLRHGKRGGLRVTRNMAITTRLPGHDAELAAHRLLHGQLVDPTRHFTGAEHMPPRFTVAPHRIPRGRTATYFPEATVLVPVDHVAEINNPPRSKFIVITVQPTGDPAAALVGPRAARS